MTALDDLSVLREKSLSAAVDKFEELLQQNGRAFLMGAGCSQCAGLPLMAELTKEAMESEEFDATGKTILAAVRGLFDGAANSNIEDYLSELVEAIS